MLGSNPNQELSSPTRASTSEPWAAWAIRALAAMACFTPLVTYDLGLTPIFTKATYFRMLVIFMSAIWVVLAIYDRRYRPNWRNPLLLTVSGYTALSVALLPLSMNPSLSFWSTSMRMTGISGLIYLWAWFVVLHSVQKKLSHWIILVATLSAAGALVGFSALAELFSGSVDRTSGTMDNPVFLASFSTLCFWLTVWLMTAVTKRSHRIAIGALAAVHLISVGITGTRASGLALAATIGLGVCLLLWRLLKTRRGTVFLTAVSAIVVAALAWLRLAPEYVPPFIARFSQANLGADRIYLWLVALQGFVKKPIVGWGHGNFEAAFNALSDPTGVNWLNTASWNDRVHNEFLDVLVGQGALGAVAFLTVWAAALWLIMNREARNDSAKSSSSAAALGLLVAAHAVQLSFSFETPSSAMVFMMSLALISFPTLPAPSEEDAEPPPNLAIEAALVIALLVAWYTNLQPLGQAAKYRQGEALFLSGSPQHHEILREAVSERSQISSDLRYKLVDLLQLAHETQLAPPPEWKDVTKLTASEASVAADGRPFDYRTQLAAAEANRLFGKYYAPSLNSSRDYAERAIGLSPQRSKGWEALGEAKLAQGDYEAAKANFERALTLTTYDLKNARVHFRLCETSLMEGDVEAAARDYRIALRLGHDQTMDLSLMSALLKSPPSDKLPPVFLDYLSGIDPVLGSQLSVLTAKALIYAKANEPDLARDALSKVRSRDAEIADSLSDTVEELLLQAHVKN